MFERAAFPNRPKSHRPSETAPGGPLCRLSPLCDGILPLAGTFFGLGFLLAIQLW